MAKNIPNEIIITALIDCTTIREAASKVGLTERAIYDRMKTDAFRALYKQVREQILNTATARLQSCTNTAITTLEDVMSDTDASPQTRVNAASALLQYCLKFTQCTDLQQQVDDFNTSGYVDALSKSLEEMAVDLESDIF